MSALEAGGRTNPWAMRSLQAGLFGLFLDFLTLSLFGAGFPQGLAFGLTATASLVAVSGVLIAHASGHARRRDPRFEGVDLGTAGLLLSLLAFVIAAFLNGLLGLLLVPLFWPFWIVLGIVAATLHLRSRAAEQAFAATYDASSESAACSRCAQREFLRTGRWMGDAWICRTCSAGGSA